ncbi:uncharacterized protein RJT21DRAFT_120083 [Scheffersomyces amazonensis]|uniref:uncharacterized protein n=1 Tax=Scheffersomyces amazonensis TaxID=1078765 RepID=UPI00315DBBC4
MLARQGLGLLRKPWASTMKFPTTRLLAARSLTTIKASHDQEQELLVAQRKNRPTSPHLSIYQPQLTWILSSFHRITGVGLAAGFYALTCSYAATSLLGIQFDGATIAGVFASLPFVVKLGAKFVAAYPFAFHLFNGIRHLVWDLGQQLTIKGVYTTGYIVLGATGLLGTYLAFF